MKMGEVHTMLKYKPVFDREAIIIDYKKGDGKYKGKLGHSYVVPLLNRDQYMIIDKDDSHIFTLILGWMTTYALIIKKRTSSNDHRMNAPDILIRAKPRFGRYIRIREDDIQKECVKILPMNRCFLKKSLENSEYAKALNQEGFRYKSYRTINQALSTLSNDEELIDGIASRGQRDWARDTR